MTPNPDFNPDRDEPAFEPRYDGMWRPDITPEEGDRDLMWTPDDSTTH